MADYDVETTGTDDAPKTASVVETALKRLQLAKEAVTDQRARERKALRFQVPEFQWDDEMRKARQAAEVDGMKLPARPMLSIPKLNQPIQLVLNQEKAAHLGVTISPLTEDADDDTAEVMQDLYRREEQRGRAGRARSWGFDRAVKAGFGVYAIDTCYDDESNNPSDQRLEWRKVEDAGNVYFDPSVPLSEPEKMEYAFELQWVRLSQLKREYKDSAIARMDDAAVKAMVEEQPEWINDAGESDDPYLLVAVYWCKEYTERTYVALTDGTFAFDDEAPPRKVARGRNAYSRTVQVPHVKRHIICGDEELQAAEEWNGKYIPLIPVIGVELQPFDDKRRLQGVIEPAMDSQKLFNYAASNAVETAATEPKAKYVMYNGQQEGFEGMWGQANIRNFPYLLVNPTMVDGKPAPLPQLLQADTSKLTQSMMLLEKADQFLQASTTTLDQTRIEAMGRRKVAHETIQALQEQSDLGNSHYLHNLATISMPYEAKVVIDLMAKIYDRPGRVARLLDLEDDERTVMLNQPFKTDDKGRPVPVPVGRNGQPVEQGGAVKHYDLRKGTYGVAVSIGKSWQTRVQQGADELGELLKDPEMFALLGPTYLKFRDFPGAKEAADLVKRFRAMKFPGIDVDPNDPNAGPSREELMGQLQAMQQQLKETNPERMKLQIARENNDAQLQGKRMDNEVKLAVAAMSAKVETLTNLMQVFVDERARVGTQQHDAALAAADAGHEEQMAGMAHQQALEQGEQGQQHAIEQGAVTQGAQ